MNEMRRNPPQLEYAMNKPATVVDDFVEEEPRALAVSQPATPMAMLSQAVANGASIEVLDKLMTLAERWEANQGRKAFDAAIAAAKAGIPPIVKNRLVDFTGKTGIRTRYEHEDLAEIARTVDPILGQHGLSYRFRTKQEDGQLYVTCILSHRDGHSEENTLHGRPDDSGNKNSIQAVGSTATFLQRYTLKLSLGLAAGHDDDGKGADTGSAGTITPAQRDRLQELIAETDSDIAAFCGFLKIEALSDLPANQFPRALAALEAKRAKLKESA